MQRAAKAELYLARGDRAAAVREATRAVADARGRNNSLEALFQGSVAGSAELRAEYQRIDAGPAVRFRSRLLPLLADAVVAVEDGRHQQALDLIGRELPEVPPGPILATMPFPMRQPRIVATYFWVVRSSASATPPPPRAISNVVDAGYFRLYMPIEYVRSFYYLGQIAERQGDAAKAREHYRRFLFYWKDGDIDRDKVADAIKKTS